MVQKQVEEAFAAAIDRFDRSPPVMRILQGEVTKIEYAEFLRQVFHHSRENPQIQALATVFFRGSQRELVKPFFKHATSEIGHDQLALDDIEALGVSVDGIREENPLPATTALIAFPFFQIYNLNAIGYLGYLFFLEHMPTRSGKSYLKGLTAAGIPREATTFIFDHSTIDQGHNKLMSMYLDHLVETDRDVRCVCYGLQVCAELYASMVQRAFEFARSGGKRTLSGSEVRAPGPGRL